jgi:hypothetical protein
MQALPPYLMSMHSHDGVPACPLLLVLGGPGWSTRTGLMLRVFDHVHCLIFLLLLLLLLRAGRCWAAAADD